jgi:transcriptional regulator with XRE-family HTH domain
MTKRGSNRRLLAAIGDGTRAARIASGMTQEVLAYRAGIHPTYLSGIERGVKNPSVGVLGAIAAALAIPVSTLFKEQ